MNNSKQEVELINKPSELDRFFTITLDLRCITDTRGSFLKTNDAWETIFGYRIEALENHHFCDFVHPDDLPATLEALAQLGHQPVIEFVNRYRKQDGTYRFIEWRTQSDGTLIYAAARDITDHKQAEAVLEQRNLILTTLHQGVLEIGAELDVPTLLHRIMDRAVALLNADRGGGIYLFDAEHNVLRLEAVAGINEGRKGVTLQPNTGAAGRVFQTGQPLIINNYTNWEGRTTVLILDPPSAVMGVPLRISDQVAGALLVFANSQERTYALEDVQVAEMFAAQAATALRNARLYTAAQQEIADRQQMSQALHQSEEYLRLSLQGTRAGTWEWNLQTGEVIFNQRWAEIVGYTLEELAPIDEQTFVKLAHPEDYDRSQELLQMHFRGETEYYEFEVRMRHKAGHWVWVLTSGMITSRTEDGKPLRMFGTHLDITRRKQAQQHEFNLALEKERVRLLTQFIQNAAHEFRTPLANIMTSIDLIARVENVEHTQKKSQQIRLQVKRLTRLVDTLLLMAQLERQESLERLLVDIRVVIEATCYEIVAKYGQQPRLFLEIPVHLPKIKYDGYYLSKALGELLDNAYRFTPQEGTITVLAEVVEGEIQVEIRDTGAGIAEEDLPHLFEIFWRHDKSHSTAGFGLGLPIAQRIINAHGGTITVQSQAGQGTSVCVTLPVASDSEQTT